MYHVTSDTQSQRLLILSIQDYSICDWSVRCLFSICIHFIYFGVQ